MMPRAALVAVFCLVAAVPSEARQAPPPGAAGAPVAPTLPETLLREESGLVTVRAVRVTSPLRLDGQLDEPFYRELRPASDFIQEEPSYGAPATEKTEIWILFDDENVYVGARIWESQPERMVVNEMRRDSANVFQNENLTIVFDTFYDRRNGVGFVINPLGGRQDGQITNERWSRDWNTIFDFGVGEFDGGWTAELAVPFKSLRYRPGPTQIWGVNARRVSKWKNEFSNLVSVPNSGVGSGVYRMSVAATLVGLEVPPGSKNLEIKPYAISNLTTDRNAIPTIANDLSGNFGTDVKYGITQNLIADFTYNTDFAQVEADEQQINLTRFSLFFPEKREFFLENPGLFAFGGVATVNQGQLTSDAPMLFYSRRIGLNQGRVVPLEAGGRLTGRIGRYSLGLLNLQTGDERVSRSRPTNFSVVRLKRDVLRRSSIGLIATGRSVSMDGSGSNAVYGVDGLFSFFNTIDVNTSWARTRTTGLAGDDASYRASFGYVADRYGVELERLAVGANFNPEVGFVRRSDVRRTAGNLRFSPRPRSSRVVRKYSWTASLDYSENGAGRLETRDVDGQFGIEFQNSDRFTATLGGAYELLLRPFRIAPGIFVPVGGYDTERVRLQFTLGTQRRMSGNFFGEHGSFYSGHRTAVGYTGGRVNLSPRLSVDPTYSINRVRLAEGSFTTRLAGARVTYSLTPLMFVGALLQYNSTNHTVATNARLRWEYRPGSELFVVFNEERDTLARNFPGLANRSFIVKINRLLRF
jgi:hypothetical protein